MWVVRVVVMWRLHGGCCCCRWRVVAATAVGGVGVVVVGFVDVVGVDVVVMVGCGMCWVCIGGVVIVLGGVIMVVGGGRGRMNGWMGGEWRW